MPKKKNGLPNGRAGYIIRMLMNACLKYEVDIGNGSPYVMTNRLMEKMGRQPPEPLYKADRVMWLISVLKELGFTSKSLPDGKSVGQVKFEQEVARGDKASVAKEKLVGKTITHKMKTDFYASWEWATLRMEILKKYGRECMCCGAQPGNGVQIHVDHIKPLSKYWEMRLVEDNLQVLCASCNQGKGAWDETDYRPKAAEQVVVGVVLGDSWDDFDRQVANAPFRT